MRVQILGKAKPPTVVGILSIRSPGIKEINGGLVTLLLGRAYRFGRSRQHCLKTALVIR